MYEVQFNDAGVFTQYAEELHRETSVAAAFSKSE